MPTCGPARSYTTRSPARPLTVKVNLWENEDGFPCHGSVYLTDGDATYKAYLSARAWDPDH